MATPEAGSNGAAIGGAVGGVIAALLLIGAVVFFVLRARKTRAPAAEMSAKQPRYDTVPMPKSTVVSPSMSTAYTTAPSPDEIAPLSVYGDMPKTKKVKAYDVGNMEKMPSSTYGPVGAAKRAYVELGLKAPEDDDNFVDVPEEQEDDDIKPPEDEEEEEGESDEEEK